VGAGQTTSSEAELAFREGMYFSNKYNNLHQPENFEKRSPHFNGLYPFRGGGALTE
jgi:hypothetical protein